MRTLLFLAACAAPLALPLTPAAATLDQVDQDFLNNATQTSLSEIQDAQWADKMSAARTIRVLSQQLIRSEAVANADAKHVAEQTSVSLPTRPQPAQQDIRAQLKNLHGSALDQAYLQDEVSRHQQAIAACQEEIRAGHNPAVRALATKWVPRLQRELDWIQAARRGRT